MQLQFYHFNKYVFKKTLRQSVKETRKLIMESTLLMPPKSVRGMTKLYRNLFNKTVKIPKLDLGNSNTSSIVPYIKKYFLKMENLKPIQNVGTCDNQRIALLNPLLIKNWTDLEPMSRENIVALGINERNFKVEELTLTYDNWRSDEILKSVLPADKEGLSSFSKIGHIVHVNLKDHLLPYKSLIGQVLLDKVKACRTVVNKIESIDTTFRFFKMEILCGEDNMQCQVKENHCRFEFDFSTVYWNPRLCTEHERISNLLKSGDVLYDVFAGVGPFAIPCAKKKVLVLANDLNPNSYKWLNHNAKLNKISDKHLRTFNKDGRDFITNDLKTDLLQRLNDCAISSDNRIHITMNLPAMAVEFLDVFNGLFSNEELLNVQVVHPLVHVYCFARNDFPKKNAQELMENHLGHAIDKNLCEIFHVRNISPKKDMWRVSFELTSDILTGKNPKKRKCTSDAATDTKKSIAMGKQKKKAAKKSNVFKVAGAKGLKQKAKAKPVKTKLKKINVSKKITEIDETLTTLRDKVRQVSKKSPAKKTPAKKSPAKAVAATKSTRQTTAKKTVKKLNSLKV